MYKALGAVYNTLGSQYGAVLFFILQRKQSGPYLFRAVAASRFCAEACKYLVCVVVMPAITMFVMIMMVMLMLAMLVMIVVVMLMLAMLVMIVVVMLMLTMPVMIVVVMLTLAMLVMVVVVMLTLAMLVMVMVVMLMLTMLVMIVVVMLMLAMPVMVVVVMLTLAMPVMIVVMMLTVRMVMSAFGAHLYLFCKLLQLILQSVLLFKHLKYLRAGKLIPGGGKYVGGGVMLADKLYASIQLCVGGVACVAEYYGVCAFYLVIEKLAEVLHIHLAFVNVYNRGKGVQQNVFKLNILYSAYNVAELAYTGGLYKYAVGGILVYYLFQGFSKVSHKAAADASGIHFGNVNSRILQKASVYAYVTKFVFYKHKLFALVCFLNKLFDKGGLSGSQKS